SDRSSELRFSNFIRAALTMSERFTRVPELFISSLMQLSIEFKLETAKEMLTGFALLRVSVFLSWTKPKPAEPPFMNALSSFGGVLDLFLIG
ncbi:TPA: hypothetical protein ACMEWZ_005721, partial [Klebsiella pneumoniae]